MASCTHPVLDTDQGAPLPLVYRVVMHHGTASGQSSPLNHHQDPALLLWELTRACALACAHCRAAARTDRDESELSTAEACAVLDSVRRDFGPILVVLTGGDPLLRPDLEELAAHGTALGLRIALTPSATPLLTHDRLASVVRAGVRRLAISIDGPDARAHDGFRGVAGTFHRSIHALSTARDLGLETQVNSSIGPHNRHRLHDMAELVSFTGARLWSVFQIVPTGRAGREMVGTAGEHERTWRELAAIASTAPFGVKTTAGQPFYRVLAQLGAQPATPRRFVSAAINDGDGVVFIAHDGTVQPSGFLAENCGNVRERSLADIYRRHTLFTALRDRGRLGGKCGRCEHRLRCGGSRSRAWALTGDALAADPTCPYQPPAAVLEESCS
jgi:radical SAM protein with 4Fe4S-binding SPASM domain